MRLNGKPLTARPTAIASPLNNYLASGGDSLTAFTKGTDLTDKDVIDLDALVAWIAPGRTPARDRAGALHQLAERRLVEAAQLA